MVKENKPVISVRVKRGSKIILVWDYALGIGIGSKNVFSSYLWGFEELERYFFHHKSQIIYFN